jgi:hypothetical protein
MNAGVEALPDDVEALKAALIVARAEAAAARAQQSDDQALIAHLKRIPPGWLSITHKSLTPFVSRRLKILESFESFMIHC